MSTSKSRANLPSQADLAFSTPLNFLYCNGPIMFRTQGALDMACLLENDPNVISWYCDPPPLFNERQQHQPDFLVVTKTGHLLLDVFEYVYPPQWAEEAAKARSDFYQVIDVCHLPRTRLRNAKDLQRYAGREVALGDRVRLLIALGKKPFLTVEQAYKLFLDTEPMAGLASLMLQRFVSIDIDDEPIGPKSKVRLWTEQG